MTTISLTEAKARLSEIADEVDRTHDRVHVTRNGKDYVVLLAAEDLESMEATIELLADPGAVDRIRQAEQDVAAGQTTSLLEMQALMDRRRILDGKSSRTRNS
jgi:antitoxin YefM